MTATQKEWRSWVHHLRTAFPPADPVHVVRREIRSDRWAQTLKGVRGGRSCFIITIDSRIPNAFAHMILLHEWAHALAWDDDEPGVDHGPAWGIAHARLWKDYYGDEDHTR